MKCRSRRRRSIAAETKRQERVPPVLAWSELNNGRECERRFMAFTQKKKNILPHLFQAAYWTSLSGPSLSRILRVMVRLANGVYLVIPYDRVHDVYFFFIGSTKVWRADN